MVCEDGSVLGTDQPGHLSWLPHLPAVQSWANDFLTLSLGFPISLPHSGPSLTLQVRTGFLMNLMGVLLLSLAMNTWAQTIFQLDTFPEWANIHLANVTALPSTLANDTFRTL